MFLCSWKLIGLTPKLKLAFVIPMLLRPRNLRYLLIRSFKLANPNSLPLRSLEKGLSRMIELISLS
uniref:Uncharacterized protein n=1 Tax=Rhizophora mucronata TaxID=61149 RepID=A0A2P2QY98_RHIMU